MASLAEQPKNINYLTGVQFKFELVDYPELNFFVQGVNLPGLSTQAAQMPFPRQPGIQKNLGVIEFEMLSIQFLVDEYLKNYAVIIDKENEIITNSIEKSTKIISDFSNTSFAELFKLAPLFLYSSSFIPRCSPYLFSRRTDIFKSTNFFTVSGVIEILFSPTRSSLTDPMIFITSV